MAMGLSHELNQLLAAINNYLNGSRRFLDRGDPAPIEQAKAVADRAVAPVSRAGETIRRLRGFVNKSEAEKSVEDVNVLVREAIDLVSFSTGQHGAAMRLNTAGEPRPVLVDKPQIQQVVVNIVRNAIEAMDSSAQREIVIDVSGVAGRSGGDRGRRYRSRNRRAYCTAAFSALRHYQATGHGHGLALCRSIMGAHGGRLWSERNSDGGMTFRFTVPAAGLPAILGAG